MANSEIWKPIADYEGLYEISTLGNVRSVYRYKKVLKPMLSNTGYYRVDLFKDKKRRQFSVHRLVANAFIDHSIDKNVVNHIDENKLNNNVNNLEWVTNRENCLHGTAIARRTAHTNYKNRKINNKNQILVCSKPIIQFTKSGEFIRVWASAAECSRATGFSQSGIRRVVAGERNSIFGYIFKEGSEDLLAQ